jgi:imidazole glycerol-phosphate synthase subunit HisH
MISIIDYGLGNIMAFSNIYKKLNIPLNIVSNPDELMKAEKIILPGVGSFDWAMKKLSESGLRKVLEELVISKKIPILGVCVGMQIMAQSSEEGSSEGLGWINADVKKFQESNSQPLPHMGWNKVNPVRKNPLFMGLDDDARFYFLHSFYFDQKDQPDLLSETSYQNSFTSSVNKENIYGVQFHPEKSHKWGEQLLKNFSELI